VYGEVICDRSGVDLKRSITIEVTDEQLERLDDLRSERNLSREQLIGELLEHATPKRLR